MHGVAVDSHCKQNSYNNRKHYNVFDYCGCFVCNFTFMCSSQCSSDR